VLGIYNLKQHKRPPKIRCNNDICPPVPTKACCVDIYIGKTRTMLITISIAEYKKEERGEEAY